MTKEQFTKKKLPDEPGVYFFLGARKKILYIGKATSLKHRVTSYFDQKIGEKRSPLIEKMVEEAKEVQFTVTDSVVEALILETNLIRTHKPTYNTRSKDDKSYNHLIITKEEWPRILIVRGKDLVEKTKKTPIQYHFGPFTNGTLLKETLKIVQRLFKFYDTRDRVGAAKSKMARGKILFNQQIGIYPENTDPKVYAKVIRQIKLFFQGKKQQIIKELEKEMMVLAKKQEFEQAAIVKRKIFALKHIEEISLLKNDFKFYRDPKSIRIEAYDIAHYRGQEMVGVMVVLEGGEEAKNEYRKFKIKTLSDANDPAALREVLTRRLTHDEWPLPQLIVVDGALPQKNAVEKVLREHQLVIPVASVVKDDNHKAHHLLATAEIKQDFSAEIIKANAESHRFAIGFYRKLARKKLTLPAVKIKSHTTKSGKAE